MATAERYGQIDVPVLLAWGEDDKAFKISLAERMQRPHRREARVDALPRVVVEAEAQQRVVRAAAVRLPARGRHARGQPGQVESIGEVRFEMAARVLVQVWAAAAHQCLDDRSRSLVL